jgi:hypothetical protein
LGRSKFISQVDLKAGFYNCRLQPSSQPFTAFSTQQGTYVWTRMSMGLQNAPAHFQWVMESIVHDPQKRPLPATILLDDTTTYHDDLDACLEDGVEAILRLTEAGAMVGPAKCVLGADEAEHMGE